MVRIAGSMDSSASKFIPDTGPDAEAPFRVFRPAVHSAPLALSSPHSGRNYPPAFLAAARLDPVSLRRSEDWHVDRLFSALR